MGVMFLTALRRVPPAIWVAVAGGLVVVIVYTAGYKNGVLRTTAKFDARIEKFEKQVDDLNRKAIERARRQIAEMKAANDVREKLLAELDALAAGDPTASDVALGVDSVRRIGSVK